MVAATNAFGFPSSGTNNNGDTVAPGVQMSENKDMFTKLLVAQIRNQDPLAPSDPSQFVNQLSQLSQTEALENLAQTTTASASMLQSLQVLGMGSQVGSEISVETGRVRIDGAKINASVQLTGASNLTAVTLTSAGGQTTRIELPAHGSGPQSFTIDPEKLGLPAGSYSIAAEASDGTKPAIEVTARLDSVRLSANGGLLLNVAGVGEIGPEYITSFKGKPAAQVAAVSDN
ncbi:flagellar basal body rod modification protein [Massilia sp. KIM]|uniref:flagellar hook capping FlgD N-terminal domain-containing protein n=1 Tax=Massilia sp. KIM TaxID=1955422 RepID=UPI00098FB7FF|nr:flagellar hook capping FlgD N-terminal domain-containing protein [Massilia sp. KIM]OON64116.1 flagellar basal body rod modification protein [Massilia sp. KIM]